MRLDRLPAPMLASADFMQRRQAVADTHSTVLFSRRCPAAQAPSRASLYLAINADCDSLLTTARPGL